MDPAEPSDADPRGGILLGSPVARRILDLVRGSPGVSAQEVGARLGLSWATVTYHRRRLERDGLLRTAQEGRRRVLHTGDPGPSRSLAALQAMLRGETMRRVALAIQREPGLGEADLARAVGLPPRALAYQVDRLLAAGLVEPPTPQRRDALAPTPLLDLLLAEPDAPHAAAPADLRDDAHAHQG